MSKHRSAIAAFKFKKRDFLTKLQKTTLTDNKTHSLLNFIRTLFLNRL